jgi:GH15 family glucan-1,4-alpha-glucosidase
VEVRVPLKIEDYALIGDTHTAALVGNNGSIDWLCFPRFDSAACFAALLGDENNGHWKVAPDQEVRAVRRRYRGDTLVLETDFETDTGLLRVTDAMYPRANEHLVLRLAECIRGVVPVRSELTLRFDYGSVVPWVRRLDDGTMLAVAGPDAIAMRCEVSSHGENLTTISEAQLTAGESLGFSMVWHRSHRPLPAPVDVRATLDEIESWWASWMAGCTYDGHWQGAVRRSLTTLKALTYAPTGGIVAAATTSLPEQLGGVRNWDYRFCWLRDATITLLALLDSGFASEASEWRDWLLRAIAGDPAKLQIMYGVGGERRLPEYEIPWLPGYEGAAPVRIGNAAVDQFQLDVYGEVMDALAVARTQSGADDSSWSLQTKMMEFLEEGWRKPDEGIWEVRGPSRHFVHSKVMAWVAFDRAIRGVDQFHLPGPKERWTSIRDEIKTQVLDNGYDGERNTFTQYYGSKELDASLLIVPLVGFLPPKDPRATGTIAAIERELMHDGFVQRYSTSADGSVDGLPEGEGAFLACSFWLADNKALMGDLDGATELFDRLLDLRNDVGLLAEEWDPIAGRMTGNFPQAFSHVPLINTARSLSQAMAGESPRQGRFPPSHFLG